ncbi:hypothetical protein EYF80_006926 [Liparis tanakae]|uniref:Uncharacterized protein n=1 Tax=Liparis tanakae TaxID=230148 RepID=A0A4Z2IYB2_9TELE|nr:hypothetical protein EYF80_006926 [Liparis tanakae]
MSRGDSRSRRKSSCWERVAICSPSAAYCTREDRFSQNQRIDLGFISNASRVHLHSHRDFFLGVFFLPFLPPSSAVPSPPPAPPFSLSSSSLVQLRRGLELSLSRSPRSPSSRRDLPDSLLSRSLSLSLSRSFSLSFSLSAVMIRHVPSSVLSRLGLRER